MAALAGITSVISLLDVGVRAASSLRQVIQDRRNAPAEILALSNEVQDFAMVMYELKITCQDVRSNALLNGRSELLPILTQHMNRARSGLKAVEALIDNVHMDQKSETTMIMARVWSAKKQSACNLKDGLREVKINIQLLLQASTTMVTAAFYVVCNLLLLVYIIYYTKITIQVSCAESKAVLDG